MEENGYLFPGDSYDTPSDVPKSIWYRLLLKNRLYFYANNFYIFFQTGRCGKRGQLTQERQIFYSNKNLRLVERCGGKVHLRGLDNLRALNGRSAVLVGNHMSMLETALFHSVARGIIDFTFIIKQSLMSVPFFRDIMTSLGAIPIGRENPRDDLKAVFEEGGKLLASGRSIIVFPQSTRSEDFSPEKFNSIGLKLAKRAGVPVLPFALKTDFQGNGRFFRDFGPVRPEREVWFEFGEPREVTGNGQELQQEIISFIKEHLQEWCSRESKEN